MKRGASDLRQRFEGFAARFGEGLRGKRGRGGPTPSASPKAKTDYWQSVQDLFTRDVTTQDLGELVGREAPDAFRYFAREVDLVGLLAAPWYKRYPSLAFHVLQAMAYRLSPARRVLFAAAVFFLGLGWVRQLLSWTSGGWRTPGLFTSLLVAATLLFVLLAMELRDKLALKSDLEVARQIQFGLLPFEPYERAGIAVEADMRPANTVGGDYFDTIELGEGRLALVMGDVAGKGMPAALLMALLQGSLRTLLTAGLRGEDLIAKLNAHLWSNIPTNRLVTLFYAELEAGSGALRYVNAGHNPPYLLRAGGGVERLPATAMALGVLKESRFESRKARLGPGDRLFLFTDGVSEAFDAKDAEYGEARLESCLLAQRGSSGKELIRAVLADVLAFCGEEPQRDDMTLMVVRRELEGEATSPPPGKRP